MTVKSPKKLIEKIKEKGIMAGIAISPETPVKKIEKLLFIPGEIGKHRINV